MHVHIHKSCLPPSPRCAYRIGFEELLESFVRSTISRATGIPVSPSNNPDTQYSLDRTFRDHFILEGKKKKNEIRSNFSSRTSLLDRRSFEYKSIQQDKGKATFEVTVAHKIRTISPIPRTICSCFTDATRWPFRLICRDSNGHKYFQIAPLHADFED